MKINYWLLTPLLIFIAVQTVGYSFYHALDEVCPVCNGTGEVWRPAVDTPFGVIQEGYWQCSECRGAGFFWQCSVPTAVALYSLLFTFIFLGVTFLDYVSSAFYAVLNPWVGQVKEMNWHFNPMYWVWLFETDRRTWAVWNSLTALLVTPFIGFMLFYILVQESIALEDSTTGFAFSCVFLSVLALCWYKGFWKPRTTESPMQVPEHIEAEWRTKRL